MVTANPRYSSANAEHTRATQEEVIFSKSRAQTCNSRRIIHVVCCLISMAGLAASTGLAASKGTYRMAWPSPHLHSLTKQLICTHSPNNSFALTHQQVISTHQTTHLHSPNNSFALTHQTTHLHSLTKQLIALTHHTTYQTSLALTKHRSHQTSLALTNQLICTHQTTTGGGSSAASLV